MKPSKTGLIGLVTFLVGVSGIAYSTDNPKALVAYLIVTVLGTGIAGSRK